MPFVDPEVNMNCKVRQSKTIRPPFLLAFTVTVVITVMLMRGNNVVVINRVSYKADGAASLAKVIPTPARNDEVYVDGELLPVAQIRSGNEVRVSHMRAACRRIHGDHYLARAHNLTYIENNRRAFRKMMVDDEYGLIFAPVPKVSSNTWRNLLLMLRHRLPPGAPLDRSYNRRLHADLLHRYSSAEILHRLRTYYKFTVIRHPLERLVATYYYLYPDRYSKYHLGPILPTKAQRKARTVFNLTLWDALRVGDQRGLFSFDTFAQFVIADLSRGGEPTDGHWSRISDTNRPCVVDYDFLVEMSDVRTQSNYILHRLNSTPAGVVRPVRLAYPRRSVMDSAEGYRGKYGGRNPARTLRDTLQHVRPETLAGLRRVYNNDYQIFGYDLAH